MVRREVARARIAGVQAVRRATLGTEAGSNYTAQVQGHDAETWEGVEVWQQVGLASRPSAGAEAVVVALDGAGEGAVVVATQDRGVRPTLATGEVALHGIGSDRGQVTMRASGDVDHEPAGTGTVNVGGTAAACVDYLLLGTTYDSAMRLCWGATVAIQFGVMAPLFTTLGDALAALATEGALSLSARNKCTAAATACGGLAVACNAMVTGINKLIAGSYLASKGKVH